MNLGSLSNPAPPSGSQSGAPKRGVSFSPSTERLSESQGAEKSSTEVMEDFVDWLVCYSTTTNLLSQSNPTTPKPPRDPAQTKKIDLDLELGATFVFEEIPEEETTGDEQVNKRKSGEIK